MILVYEKGIEASGKIQGYIEEAGITVVPFNGAVEDAPDHSTNAAAEAARAANADGVVAVGGGSSIGTGKGVCFLLSNDPPIQQYYFHPGMEPKGDLSNLKPVVVLPTTAGTGSEVTPGGTSEEIGNIAANAVLDLMNEEYSPPSETMSSPKGNCLPPFRWSWNHRYSTSLRVL